MTSTAVRLGREQHAWSPEDIAIIDRIKNRSAKRERTTESDRRAFADAMADYAADAGQNWHRPDLVLEGQTLFNRIMELEAI
jgi:hypothetical protein